MDLGHEYREFTDYCTRLFLKRIVSFLRVQMSASFFLLCTLSSKFLSVAVLLFCMAGSGGAQPELSMESLPGGGRNAVRSALIISTEGCDTQHQPWGYHNDSGIYELYTLVTRITPQSPSYTDIFGTRWYDANAFLNTGALGIDAPIITTPSGEPKLITPGRARTTAFTISKYKQDFEKGLLYVEYDFRIQLYGYDNNWDSAGDVVAKDNFLTINGSHGLPLKLGLYYPECRIVDNVTEDSGYPIVGSKLVPDDVNDDGKVPFYARIFTEGTPFHVGKWSLDALVSPEPPFVKLLNEAFDPVSSFVADSTMIWANPMTSGKGFLGDVEGFGGGMPGHIGVGLGSYVSVDRVEDIVGKFTVSGDVAGGRLIFWGMTPAPVAPPGGCSPPVVVPQPPVEVAAGDILRISSQAVGSWELTYQWYKDGEILPGRTASHYFQVGAEAADAGIYQVRVSNGCGSIDSEPIQVSVTGTASPEISVSVDDGATWLTSGSSNVDFGITSVNGGEALLDFTIHNLGGAALDLTGNPLVAVGGLHSADFTIVSPPGTPVPVGGSASFIVRFDPSASGSRNATLSIANNDSDENPFHITLQGTGTTAPTMPTVTTTAASGVTANSATIGGNVTNSGGGDVTERGVVYATTQNPTTGNATKAEAGSGTGRFTRSLTGLTPHTTYHVRAYAINSVGTAYGAQVSFTSGEESASQDYFWSNFAGIAGEWGNTDGTGAAARFMGPEGVAVDASGNVYVADGWNHTIRKITPVGVVSTLAGSAGEGGSADGAGSAARFMNPQGVAVDASGNVYVVDSENHTIRKITPGGIVSTLAGSAGERGRADGAGSVARFYRPAGIVVGASGNVYVADSENHTIRKITPGGIVSTLAGSPEEWGSVDGPGSVAKFHRPSGIAVDASGNIYVADSGNNTIRRITPAGVVSTIGGKAGTTGGSDGLGSLSVFTFPNGMAIDASGVLFVSDNMENRIVKGTPVGILAWRKAWFGSPENTGNAADNFDYDHDGLVNLLEFAFGLNPTQSDSKQMPQFRWNSENVEISFTAPPGVFGITYGAEWSTTMAANDWHAIPNVGAGSQHSFNVPTYGKSRLFLRLTGARDP